MNENNVKRKNNKGLIVIIVILLITIIGLLVYIIYGEKNIENIKDNDKVEEKQDKQEKKKLIKDNSKDIVYTYLDEKIDKKIEGGEVVYTRSFKIPQVNIDSEYAEEINEDIINNLKKVYDEAISDVKENKMTYYEGEDYTYFINDNILSLVAFSKESQDYIEYYVYNIDIYTGEKVDKDVILKRKNIDENNFPQILSNTIQSINIEYLDSNYIDKTISLENCSIENDIFLNDKNELNVIINIYKNVGVGVYKDIVNLNTKSLVNFE